jgi:hypothetical protein
MSKGNTFENDLLKLIFQGEAIANLADNAAASPLASLYFALHTADPGESGNQTTSEASYGAYARVAVARSIAGFAVTGNVVQPQANVDWPECTSGTDEITHFSIGTAASGTGKILYKGPFDATISVSTGVTPRLKTDSTITED